MIYPWQERQWKHLEDAVNLGKLGHGLLLIGQEGMGKLDFAEAFASKCLAQHLDSNQTLLALKNHPDYFCIQPLDGKSNIIINQIRELQKQLEQTSHLSKYKVVVIEPADSMNVAAANALLKVLEEPTDNTLIILVTAKPQRLPATLRSRCQIISFYPNHEPKTIEWLRQQLPEDQDAELLLNLAHGAPLTALTMLEGDLQEQRKVVFKLFAALIQGKIDPIEVANQWQCYDVWQLSSWLQSWLLDISRIQSKLPLMINHPKYVAVISQLADCMDKKMSFIWMDKLIQFKKQLAQVKQLNIQLALEELLIEVQYAR